jgi:cell division septum initiation protein DivIVA
MAISFTRPDPSSPSSVASASFPTARKGFEQGDVREFLRMVAAELARLQERERFLERELRSSQRRTSPSSIALDEELVTKMLGEEAARILSTAREAGSQIKVRAEEGAGRLLREATDEAQRVREEAEIESARRRQDAASDAESEIEMAKQQGREMVNEARAYRERVLNELARRREMARQQIEQLVHGRDRLLQAFERSRLVAVDVMAELTPLGEPNEYVDLSPTTGPVPLMVPNMPRPVSQPAPAAVIHDREAEPEPDDDPTTFLTLVQPLPTDGADADASDDDDVAEPVDLIEPEDEVPVIEVEVIEPDELEPSELEPTDEAELDETIEMVDPDAADAPDAADDQAERVVVLDITPGDHSNDVDDPDREPAQVVALFETDTHTDDAQVDIDPDDELVPHDQSDHTIALRTSVDDLFARLRAVRADSVAQRAIDAESAARQPEPVPPVDPVPAAAPAEDSVFMATPDAPTVDVVVEDTPFARRDEVLTPLIVSAARKLKRVLADEQNDVLHALRGKDAVRTIEMMVSTEFEQTTRYVSAITPELTDAAIAGAVSMGMRSTAAQREVNKADAIASAGRLLAVDLIAPLRARLERCIADVDGDNAEMATLVRLVYREWKTQRIDEHLDDVARTAFGHGALAGVAPGTPISWIVDPQGPQCPDAEDNALAGIVPAGSAFPTDHPCAPAHSGCRCMIMPAST